MNAAAERLPKKERAEQKQLQFRKGFQTDHDSYLRCKLELKECQALALALKSRQTIDPLEKEILKLQSITTLLRRKEIANRHHLTL